ELEKKSELFQQLSVFREGEVTRHDVTSDIDFGRIYSPSANAAPISPVTEIEQTAIQQTEEFEKIVSSLETSGSPSLPAEIQKLVKSYNIKNVFKDQAEQIVLPQFYLKVPVSDLFSSGEEDVLLDKDNLLSDFKLSKADTNIVFNTVNSELYRVDLDPTKNEHTPTFIKLDGKDRDRFMAYVLDPSRKDSRVKNLTKRIMDIIGNMYPIPDKEIEKYINRVLEDFQDEQYSDFFENEYSYTDKIKHKIRSLSEAFAEQKFRDFLDTDNIFIKPSYRLAKSISPGETAKDITRSLYEKESKMNGFEEHVINEVGNMPNIVFWTRNPERKGFRINGFVNHFPDFIIQTKSNKTIVLETKGDHLDAEQKIRLGAFWANKAGNNYRYFMVYDRRLVDGAYKLEDFLNIVKDI
ncbi:MAG TPA: restriction endonuclease, partial [Dyadobacter sp.]|nr:restriction endonuclease [Dyadobacter sp.]